MHSIKLLAIIGVSLFLIAGCCTCGGEMQKEGETQMEGKAAPYPEPAPAPGMADVNAELIEMNTTDAGYVCTLKVTEVKSVGRDTPPLIKGKTITVIVDKGMVENTETLKKGGSYNLSLRSQGDMMKESTNAASWKAVSIK